MVGDPMFFDEADEIRGSIASQGRFGEVTIGGEEIFCSRLEIGEIAAASTGDENFFPDSIGAFEDDDAPSPLAGFDGAHQTSGAGSENDHVVFLIRRGLADVGIIHAGMSLAKGWTTVWFWYAGRNLFWPINRGSAC